MDYIEKIIELLNVDEEGARDIRKGLEKGHILNVEFNSKGWIAYYWD